jgi:hypothetical protein
LTTTLRNPQQIRGEHSERRHEAITHPASADDQKAGEDEVRQNAKELA